MTPLIAYVKFRCTPDGPDDEDEAYARIEAQFRQYWKIEDISGDSVELSSEIEDEEDPRDLIDGVRIELKGERDLEWIKVFDDDDRPLVVYRP